MTSLPTPFVTELPDTGCHLDEVIGEVERRLIVQALERTQGVRAAAARLLGVTTRSFRYRLAKHGIDAGTDAGSDDDGDETESVTP